MINFLFSSLTKKDWEAMARTAQFISSDEATMNKPLPDITIDPLIGTPEYETGIPIIEVPGSGGGDQEMVPPVLKTTWHCNVRISGAREQQEIEGLEQVDSEGKLLPAAARTHFGLNFINNGTVVVDGETEGVQYTNVTLIDETTIASPQRVWQ